ncbi:MAG TPA: hypothetical protein VFP94_04110 [Terriglobales bacterium]|nr:hypothetical protein [Terriglobales bacterium]
MVRMLGVAAGLAVCGTMGLSGQRVHPPAAPGPRGDVQPLPHPPALKNVPSPQAGASTVQAPQPDPLLAGHDLSVGTFYYDRGDYPGALGRFHDAIFNDPKLAEAYCRAGDTELKLKHLAAARSEWGRCMQVAGEGKWAAHARRALSDHKERL